MRASQTDCFMGHVDPRYALIRTNSVRRLYFRSKLWERDKGNCGICGGPVNYFAMDVDHVQPKSKGGSDLWGNLRISHLECNRSRGNQWEGK